MNEFCISISQINLTDVKMIWYDEEKLEELLVNIFICASKECTVQKCNDQMEIRKIIDKKNL